VLSGRVRHSSSGDRRVPWLRKSSMARTRQHDKRTNDYKLILNLFKKSDEKTSEKETGKGQNLFKSFSL
jgi:hypothetical protein